MIGASLKALRWVNPAFTLDFAQDGRMIAAVLLNLRKWGVIGTI